MCALGYEQDRVKAVAFCACLGLHYSGEELKRHLVFLDIVRNILWTRFYLQFIVQYYVEVIHCVVCTATCPQSLPKGVLRGVQSGASFSISSNLSFTLGYPVAAYVFFRLLSSLLCFFQSRFIEGSSYARSDQSVSLPSSYRIRLFLSSLTPCNTSFYTRTIQLVSILFQLHISKFSRYFWSIFLSVQVSAPQSAVLQI